MSERLFSVVQAAVELAASKSTVYKLCHDRLIRFVRVGAGNGGIRIPETAIAEFLKRREFGVGAGEAPEALSHINLSPSSPLHAGGRSGR